MSSGFRCTEDPYDYVQGCLDGSETTHVVAASLLSRCSFVLLFAKGTFKLELIPRETFAYIRAHDPFCLYSCFPIPKWADWYCLELTLYRGTLRDTFIMALAYFSAHAYLHGRLLATYDGPIPHMDDMKRDLLPYSLFCYLLEQAHPSDLLTLSVGAIESRDRAIYNPTLRFLTRFDEEDFPSLDERPFVDWVLPKRLTTVLNSTREGENQP
jgi:hypothetical protein